jgi:hypothetical protein
MKNCLKALDAKSPFDPAESFDPELTVAGFVAGRILKSTILCLGEM